MYLFRRTGKMGKVEQVSGQILRYLLQDFQSRGLGAEALENEYEGPPIDVYDNPPNSSVVLIATYSKRQYVYLTAKGYNAAR